MSNERLYKILLAPRMTEKSTRLAESSNQYVFKVIGDSNKTEIKAAVEKLFDVNVESVRIINVKGKSKTFKLRSGKRNDWKKAYIALQPGHDLDFSGNAE